MRRPDARQPRALADDEFIGEIEIGIAGRKPEPGDIAATEAMRAEMLNILHRPSNESALADRTWTARYAARRIAWHALDHAWEMEDRSDPA